MYERLRHSRSRRRPVLAVLAAAATLLAAGCTIPDRIHSAARMRNGIVFVLPGIEGRSWMNRNISLGLDDGGVASAIEIYDWTAPLPGTFVVNLTDYERNLRQAQLLADRIIEYRDKYPGNPVHLVGHSGGGGVAILALEAMPAGRQIDMVILLAAALSPDYDLSTALRRTHYGILNCYSEYDAALLKAGTTVFGSIDRQHGAAAGAVGFRIPDELAPESKELYDQRLRQVRWTERLEKFGASGSHIGWTTRKFSREYLAPLIRDNESARPLPIEKIKAQTPPADVE